MYAKPNRLGQLANNLREYHSWARLAQQQTGKSILTQLREIQETKHAGGKCGISDYYWYKLYDDDYQMGRGAKDFLGWRLQQDISLALNPRSVVLPSWDKLVFALIAGSAGLPTAPIRACFHRADKISKILGFHLKNGEMVAEFLRNSLSYPMFAKPAWAQQGYGSAFLSAYNPASDSLELLDGKSIPVATFIDGLDKTVDRRYHKPECGLLFQEAFRPASCIAALTNWTAISGVRIVCLNDKEGVTPVRAIWKVAVPPNYIDNFRGGRTGNMVADVNLETGEVGRMLNSFWPPASIVPKHPSSGKSIDNFRLPHWNQLLEACQHAGSVFPLMKIHHWDFALTDQGAMILELNDVGATEFLQLHGHGLLTERTREFLKRHADQSAFAWVRSL